MSHAPGLAELTMQERGILATRTLATSLDDFSKPERASLGSTYESPPLIRRERSYDSRGQSLVVCWYDKGQALPPWFDTLMQGFADVLTLPANWDSYGAGPIDPRLVNRVLSLISDLMELRTPAPKVVPLSGGGLQLEWHRKGIDLEIVFEIEEDPYFEYRRGHDGSYVDNSLRTGTMQLKAVLRELE